MFDLFSLALLSLMMVFLFIAGFPLWSERRKQEKRKAKVMADIVLFGILEHTDESRTWLTPFDIVSLERAFYEAYMGITFDPRINFCTVFKSVNGVISPVATVGRADPRILEPKI